MGWTFKWLSSFENDFNFDLGVAFTPEEVASKQAFYENQESIGNSAVQKCLNSLRSHF